MALVHAVPSGMRLGSGESILPFGILGLTSFCIQRRCQSSYLSLNLVRGLMPTKQEEYIFLKKKKRKNKESKETMYVFLKHSW